jgi:hypothetical protein
MTSGHLRNYTSLTDVIRPADATLSNPLRRCTLSVLVSGVSARGTGQAD